MPKKVPNRSVDHRKGPRDLTRVEAILDRLESDIRAFENGELGALTYARLTDWRARIQEARAIIAADDRRETKRKPSLRGQGATGGAGGTRPTTRAKAGTR